MKLLRIDARVSSRCGRVVLRRAVADLTATAAQAVAQHAAPQPLVGPDHREALLCQRFQAHSSAVTTMLVLTDTGMLVNSTVGD